MADPYRRLTVAQKQLLVAERQREPPVACPSCEAKTMPIQLLGHLERCTGPGEPPERSTWLRWREAAALATPAALSRWVQRGVVRVRGERGARQYLLRDVVRHRAWLRTDRRR